MTALLVLAECCEANLLNIHELNFFMLLKHTNGAFYDFYVIFDYLLIFLTNGKIILPKKPFAN